MRCNNGFKGETYRCSRRLQRWLERWLEADIWLESSVLPTQPGGVRTLPWRGRIWSPRKTAPGGSMEHDTAIDPINKG